LQKTRERKATKIAYKTGYMELDVFRKREENCTKAHANVKKEKRGRQKARKI